MVERSKTAPLFHRSTWSFLGEKDLGSCRRWEFPKGDLPCRRWGSSQRPRQSGATSELIVCPMLEPFPPLIPGYCPSLGFPQSRPETMDQGQVAYWEMQVTPVEKGHVVQGRDSS